MFSTLKKIPNIWQVRIILTIGVFAVSTAAIFVRLCQQEMGIFSDVGFSVFIASSRLLITAIIFTPTYGNLRYIRADFRAILMAVGAGICLALHFATWITSLSFTSVAASVTIVTTNPLWVSLLSWWLWGIKLKWRNWLGISIALGGSIIIALGGNGGDIGGNNPLLGAFLALLGSWFASGYILLGNQAQQRGLKIGEYVAIAYLTSALCLLPLPFIFGTGYAGYPTSVYIYLVLMAIVSQVIGHTSFNWSLRHLSPTTVSLVILLEPVGSTFLAFLLFQEIPPTTVLIGAIILLTGVIVSEYKS
ncbi:DMT family transporter [Cyanobacterium stanieri LEGE 03274]|uniref:DMT family transporter n=1 Tax=Cyanobacterium stanieri LEGE 03274 TaxID=1828756 RepID=A0ABR9V4G5_9CHRO|nr:DMT family transporter [Cyanobacterium stanieri]MBE9222742.1 DMT family transporter [Cyanobacterium stanieri LEGE 03274]